MLFFNTPCGYLRDRPLPTGFEKSSECYSYSVSAVFRARVMEKEQHTAKILEWQVMNRKMNSNSMERVQKKHLSFNSRMGTSRLKCF